MSDTSKLVIFSAIAAALSVGAVQLASGHGLTEGLLGAASTSNSVNRADKADRAQVPRSVAPTKTISLRLSEFSETSFLLRIPVGQDPAKTARPSAGAMTSPSELALKSDGIRREETKRPIACEPSVSVLTEIAKSLQPGRCVT